MVRSSLVAERSFLFTDVEASSRLWEGLVLERFPDRVDPNTGVWVLRGGQRARRFLDAVLRRGQLDHSWADQATVCSLLGWHLGDHHGSEHARARPRRSAVARRACRPPGT